MDGSSIGLEETNFIDISHNNVIMGELHKLMPKIGSKEREELTAGYKSTG